MSHQKCFQTIGVEQPRPRVCYINDCNFEKSSLEQWKKNTYLRSRGRSSSGLGQDVDLVVFASDYFLKGLYTRIKTGVTEDYGLQWDK